MFDSLLLFQVLNELSILLSQHVLPLVALGEMRSILISLLLMLLWLFLLLCLYLTSLHSCVMSNLLVMNAANLATVWAWSLVRNIWWFWWRVGVVSGMVVGGGDRGWNWMMVGSGSGVGIDGVFGFGHPVLLAALDYVCFLVGLFD